MSAAIHIQNLSKQYCIGRAQMENTIGERLLNVARLKFLRRNQRPETIWALRDVSFAIPQGEIVGVIGRNGAGKSTLLKVVSRITYPTSGTVKVNGRVASLLEVGTGFHDELTGRENIYLNGSILGMRKAEVNRKLDQIVEFSGVGKFLDTPIKRYSSGMRLRLGFAVAAHLDPDILIVDEVLAVGDAAFQKKCLNAMEDMRGGGRTVLFVSHNLAAVENLCSRGIWIDGGCLRMDGPSRSVISSYMAAVAPSETASDLDSVEGRVGTGAIRYRRVEFLSPTGHPVDVVRAGDPVVMRFHFLANEPIVNPSFGFRLYTDMGTLVTDTSTWHSGIHIPVVEKGMGFVDLEIGSLNLVPARYTLSLWLTGENSVVYDGIEQGINLEIDGADVYKSGHTIDGRHGILFWPQRWNCAGLNSGVMAEVAHR